MSKIFFTVALFIALSLSLNTASRAQASAAAAVQTKVETNASVPVSDAKKTDAETSERVKQLESQVQKMQAELETLKQAFSQKTQANQNSVNPKETAVEPAVKTVETVSVAGDSGQPKAQTNQAAPAKQLGVDIGSARLTPYGIIYFNAFNNSGSTNNQDDPLFATPTGQSGASASVRQTRLGLRLEGARVGNANLSGVLEADFFGGFPNIGIGENFGIVRIRLANAKLNWEKTSVTVGQDWMPFAPVNPISIAAAAIPQLAASGNIWARIPQVRVDHKFNNKMTLTGAVLAPQTGDYPTASSFFLQPNSGAASRVPFFQSRLAFADGNWFGTKKAGSIGVAGHYGRSRVLTGAANVKNEVDSLGLAVDWNFPLHARVTLAGEAFVGRDLGGFQAGVFQGLNTEFAFREGTRVTPAGVRGIATRGGWTQLGFTPEGLKERFTVYGSIGVDDPRNEDLTSVSRFNFRTRNLTYAANAIYRFTPQFQVGAEFRRFETQYFVTGKRANNHVNLGATYSF